MDQLAKPVDTTGKNALKSFLKKSFQVWKWFDENYWIKKSQNFTVGAKFGAPLYKRL